MPTAGLPVFFSLASFIISPNTLKMAKGLPSSNSGDFFSPYFALKTTSLPHLSLMNFWNSSSCSTASIMPAALAFSAV